MTVVGWTAHPSIVKQGADGKQTNTLSIEVGGEEVSFKVAGVEVKRLPKSKVHASGMYGFRIGHNLGVDVYEGSAKIPPHRAARDQSCMRLRE